MVLEPSEPAGDAPCSHCGSLLWFPKTPGTQAFGFRRFTISDRSVTTKKQAIVAVLNALVESGDVRAEHREGILCAILKREELGTTGIGRGLALPHARHASVERVVGGIADFSAGLDFDSLDGAPVHVVCLFVTPLRSSETFRAIEAISQRLRESM